MASCCVPGFGRLRLHCRVKTTFQPPSHHPVLLARSYFAVRSTHSIVRWVVMDAAPASNESSNITGVKQTTPATSQFQPTSETTNTPDACKTTQTDANESKVPNASVQNGNEASKPISSEPAPPSLSATLQSQIQALLALHARMPALRAIPWKMVRSQTQSTQNSLLGVVQLAGSAAGVGLGVPPVSQGTSVIDFNIE